MKLFSLCIFLFLLYFRIDAQITNFSAEFMDQSSNKVIPYVNVGVKGKSIGSNADETGKLNFKFNIENLSETDSIIISSIGYTNMIMPLSKFLELNEQTIFLIPATLVLNEVKISKKGLKEKKIGKSAHGALTHAMIYGIRDSIDDGLSQEFGVITRLKSECLLSNYNIYFSSNDFEHILFRFNIYTIDSDDSIHQYPMNESYYFESGGYGWTSLDLSEQNIVLADNRYVFTAQIVATKKNQGKPSLTIPVATPSPFNGYVYRDKSQAKWSIRDSNNPSIYLTAFCE